MTLEASGAAVEAVPGRRCPFDYRYPPSVFERPPEQRTDTLYGVGGRYGNPEALAAVEALGQAEPGPVTETRVRRLAGP